MGSHGYFMIDTWKTLLFKETLKFLFPQIDSSCQALQMAEYETYRYQATFSLILFPSSIIELELVMVFSN